MKMGNGTMPKVEIVLDDDDDNTVTHIYFPDKPADKTTISEQDVIDNNGKPIHGLDHIVDSYINMEVKLPFEHKEMYDLVVGLCLDKNGKMIGHPDPNQYVNTALYHIKFEDGTIAVYGDKIIAFLSHRFTFSNTIIKLIFAKSSFPTNSFCTYLGGRSSPFLLVKER